MNQIFWINLFLIFLGNVSCAKDKEARSRIRDVIGERYRYLLQVENSIYPHLSNLPRKKLLNINLDDGVEGSIRSGIFQGVLKMVESEAATDVGSSLKRDEISDPLEMAKYEREMILDLMKRFGVSRYISKHNIYTDQEIGMLVKKYNLKITEMYKLDLKMNPQSRGRDDIFNDKRQRTKGSDKGVWIEGKGSR